jgi:hypothetical protein
MTSFHPPSFLSNLHVRMWWGGWILCRHVGGHTGSLTPSACAQLLLPGMHGGATPARTGTGTGTAHYSGAPPHYLFATTQSSVGKPPEAAQGRRGSSGRREGSGRPLRGRVRAPGEPASVARSCASPPGHRPARRRRPVDSGGRASARLGVQSGHESVAFARSTAATSWWQRQRAAPEGGARGGPTNRQWSGAEAAVTG